MTVAVDGRTDVEKLHELLLDLTRDSLVGLGFWG